MLDYATCKKLKDAGFPQPHSLSRNYYTSLPSTHFVGGWQLSKVEDGFVLIPSLSDLIEMCGDKFMSLSCYPWRAVGDREKIIVCQANTPEEAVCNLWLALNEKKI